MKLSAEETRALAFVLGLIGLAAVARVVARPAPAQLPAAEVDAAALEQASDSALAGERARARPLGRDERIDVNGAGADELDRLPGVGPGLAARLVAERRRAGAFDSAADLRAVPGVGPALLARLAPHLRFGPGPGLPRRRPGAGPAAEAGALGAPRGPRAAAAPGRAAAPRPAPAGAPLDVNRATAAELEALPGIGPALAARIVATRDSLGGFRTLEDLLRVRGIGAATLARLRALVRV